MQRMEKAEYMQYSLQGERPLFGGDGRMQKAKKENWIISISNDK